MYLLVEALSLKLYMKSREKNAPGGKHTDTLLWRRFLSNKKTCRKPPTPTKHKSRQDASKLRLVASNT